MLSQLRQIYKTTRNVRHDRPIEERNSEKAIEHVLRAFLPFLIHGRTGFSIHHVLKSLTIFMPCSISHTADAQRIFVNRSLRLDRIEVRRCFIEEQVPPFIGDAHLLMVSLSLPACLGHLWIWRDTRFLADSLLALIWTIQWRSTQRRTKNCSTSC